MRKLIIIIILLALGILVYFIILNKTVVSDQINSQNQTMALVNQIVDHNTTTKEVVVPINQADLRITKKPFGIKISPTDSPVSPEKFSGYHVGTDFETTFAEKNIDVAIYAICDGPLILKRMASGYGGVVVQACKISDQAVTVVYGHLRLSSIAVKLDQTLKAGEQIGFLGTGYSSETDGERKHLHLSIHKGKIVNILGYVQKKTDLDNWLDFESLFK